MKRAQHGFTLVEMLVALGVATLLVSLVYGAIRVGQRSARALDRQVEQAEVMRIGWQFMHDAITRAGPTADPAREHSRTGFEGGPDSLVFIAKMANYVGIEGTMRISLGRVAAIDGDQLLLTRERLDEESMAAEDAPPEQALLVDRLEQLRIDYFGQAERGDAPAWHTSWDNPGTLPNLIRVQVEPADGAAWPVLTAAPRFGTVPLDESVVPDEATAADLPLGTAE